MSERAEFIDRLRCIACRGELLETLSGGGFGDGPLRGIIANEAWGDHPLPYIEHERWCYVRCRTCGQEFHSRILAPSWMRRLYSEWETQAAMEAFVKKQSSLDGHRRRGEHFFAHALKLHCMTAGSARQPRLLDFGCGHGEFVAVARAIGIDAIGIDFVRRLNVFCAQRSCTALAAPHAAAFPPQLTLPVSAAGNGRRRMGSQ